MFIVKSTELFKIPSKQDKVINISLIKQPDTVIHEMAKSRIPIPLI